MYNDKTLKSVAEAVKKVMEAELSTKQKAIAKMSEPKHKIDSGDLSKLRAGHKPVKEAVVKGKGYDNPENERKAPEGHAPMTSLMPGHDERAAKFLARQAKGTLVKGKAGSAPQKEPGMKKEEVEQVDEAQSHQAKTTMKHIKNPTKGEIEASKHMKSGIAGYADRIAMLKSAEARGALKNEEVKIEESDDLGPVKKKQKTVMLVHKTSGREKVIHDTPENRKKNAELGFHPVKEEVEINEMDKSQPSSSRGAEGLPVGKVAKPISYDKVKKDAYGKLKPLLNKKYKKVKEEVEQIDELKISTLARYATKANQALIGGDRSKEDKRIKGIKTAQYKILKQRANKIKEEVEQIDELSVGKLSDYQKAASKSVAYGGVDYKKDPNKFMKRLKGYMTAHDKINKKLAIKKAEQIDELTMSPKARADAKEREEIYHRQSEFPVRAGQDLSRHSTSKLRTMYTHHSNVQGSASMDDPEEKSEFHNATKSMRRIAAEFDKRGISKNKRQQTEEYQQVDERTLSSGEMEKREKYVKSMKKGLEGFKQHYGERAKEVMYATATKMAKKD